MAVRRHKLGTALTSVALLVVGACVTGDPSADCLRAMETAATETDPETANPLIVDTLSACVTADEWLAALEAHPAAMGMTETAEIGDLDLRVACWRNEDTPVCVDAIETGRIEPSQE
jgi:hypothetical protein